MITGDQVRELSAEEQAQLLRMLLQDHIGRAPWTPRQLRLRAVVRGVLTIGPLVLVPWTVWLALTLPRVAVTEHWRGAWVGFDVLLIVVLSTTAFLAWRRRQLVVVGLVCSSVLLICDAWFDVTLSAGSSERVPALLAAIVVELPLAALFGRAAWVVLSTSSKLLWRAAGQVGAPPPLRRMPLLAELVDGADATGSR